MVRNKNNSREGSMENHRGNHSDKSTTSKTTRGAPLHNDLRENTGKADKATQNRKGSPGKLNNH